MALARPAPRRTAGLAVLLALATATARQPGAPRHPPQPGALNHTLGGLLAAGGLAAVALAAAEHWLGGDPS